MQGGWSAADEATAGHFMQILTRTIEQRRRNIVLLPLLLLERVQQEDTFISTTLVDVAVYLSKYCSSGRRDQRLMVRMENRYACLLVLIILRQSLHNKCLQARVYIALDAEH
jgi:hypothetical protein